MNNNLNELNSILFETLRGLKDGTVDVKQATAVTNVGNAVINSAKLQLNAVKYIKGQPLQTDFFGEIEAGAAPSLNNSNGLYDKKLEFAKSLGYKNLADAIAKEGKRNFEQQFKAFIDNE